jgi:hypothetical protein
MMRSNRGMVLGFGLLCGIAGPLGGCDSDAEDRLDDPSTVTTGKEFLCYGKIVATATSTGGTTSNQELPFPPAGWDTSSGSPVWKDSQFDAFLGGLGQAAQSSLCGVPPPRGLSDEDFISFITQAGSAPCFCRVGDASIHDGCATACTNLLAANPALATAPGTYTCVNEPADFGPGNGGLLPGRDTGNSCDPAVGTTVSALTIGGNGGPSQYQSLGQFSFSAGDGRINAAARGVLQYSPSGDCADGCDITINRLSAAVDDSGFDRWSFTGTYAFMQGYLTTHVNPDGTIAPIPAGAGTFVVSFQSNGKQGDFIDTNRRAISGSFDRATGKLGLSTLVLESGDLVVNFSLNDSTVFASPPVAAISPTGSVECTRQGGADVILSSAGSFDPDDDLSELHWVRDDQVIAFGPTVPISLGFGATPVALNAFDSRGAVGTRRATIDIVDTTAPVWGTAPLVDLTSCDPFVDHFALTPPPVVDVCTPVTITAELISTDGVAVTPRAIDAHNAILPGGEHVVRWTGRDDFGNASTTTQTIRLGPAILATRSLAIRDRAQVLRASGALGAVGSTGLQTTQLGVSGRVTEVLSVGPVFLQSNAFVQGQVLSGGTVTLQAGAQVGGVVTQRAATVPLGRIPWLAPYAGASFGNDSLSIENAQTRTFGPGVYGRVSVKTGGTITIAGSQVSFRELAIEPGARMVIQPPQPTILIGDRFALRGTLTGSSFVQMVVFGGEALFEKPVTGIDLIAPGAKVTITTAATGSKFRRLVGQDVEIQPDNRLTCDRSAVLGN